MDDLEGWGFYNSNKIILLTIQQDYFCIPRLSGQVNITLFSFNLPYAFLEQLSPPHILQPPL